MPPPADEEQVLAQQTRRARRSGTRVATESTAPAPASSGSSRPTAPPRVSRPVPQARRTPTPPAGLTGPIRMLLGPITGSLKLGKARAEASTPTQLKIDWPQCKAHGLCAELAPDLIRLDEWGYPWFEPRDFSGEDLATIRKAIQACPTLALRLVGGQKPDRP